ncbi:hypothetical protein CC2G_003730 [Coprinopsis cinerea AmutBmut pab1-1]|nr:hypothetical protein CC2G_003730 [Coprinopsis cinerea AmutBmut pab1-1]
MAMFPKLMTKYRHSLVLVPESVVSQWKKRLHRWHAVALPYDGYIDSHLFFPSFSPSDNFPSLPPSHLPFVPLLQDRYIQSLAELFNTPSPARHTHFINSHFHSIRSEMRFTTIFVSIAAAYMATGALAAPLPVDGAAAADLAARAEDTPAPRRNLEAVALYAYPAGSSPEEPAPEKPSIRDVIRERSSRIWVREPEPQCRRKFCL